MNNRSYKSGYEKLQKDLGAGLAGALIAGAGLFVILILMGILMGLGYAGIAMILTAILVFLLPSAAIAFLKG